MEEFPLKWYPSPCESACLFEVCSGPIDILFPSVWELVPFKLSGFSPHVTFSLTTLLASELSPVLSFIPYHRIQFIPFIAGNDHISWVYVWSSSCLLSVLPIYWRLHNTQGPNLFTVLLYFCYLPLSSINIGGPNEWLDILNICLNF